jgi:mannose-6-phosphate isomerase-like protein (cupin superfamily)
MDSPAPPQKVNPRTEPQARDDVGRQGPDLRPLPVNLAERLSRIPEPWSPRIVAELNGQEVKLVKVHGTFVWHHHANEDELFLVVRGRLRMDFRDREVWLEPGELIVVPRGVEHRPHADEETEILLFEPAATLNTGNVRNERTVDAPQRI